MGYTVTKENEFKALIRFNTGQITYFHDADEARKHWQEFSSVLKGIGKVKTAELYLIDEYAREELK